MHDPLLVLQNRREGDWPDWPCVGIEPFPARHAIIGRLAYARVLRPKSVHSLALKPPREPRAAIVRHVEQIAWRPLEAMLPH